MRSQLSLKPKSYPESMDVDVAGISGKVSAHYPGEVCSVSTQFLSEEGNGLRESEGS